jgi:beta-1,4-galactosyltransferase 1
VNKKLLLIVPYRDRASHLQEFIPYITTTLYSQNIDYKIVVVEQSDEKLFNRGLLLNIGFKEYQKYCDYVVFHDVDMICDVIDYSFCDSPTSLLRHRTKSDIYPGYFGGITLFPKQDFLKINGYSNCYWGWGGEDDDLLLRCVKNNIKTATKNGKCKDLELIPEKINRSNNPHYSKNLQRLLDFHHKNTNIMNIDGLSDLNSKYKIKQKIDKNQYDLLQVFLK